MSPVRIPGAAAGKNHTADGLKLRRAHGERGLAHRTGNRRERLFRGDDDHGNGEERQGERGPENSAGPVGRRGKRLGKENAIDSAADEVDEETEAEYSEHD